MAVFDTKKADTHDVGPLSELFWLPLDLFDVGITEVVCDTHLS